MNEDDNESSGQENMEERTENSESKSSSNITSHNDNCPTTAKTTTISRSGDDMANQIDHDRNIVTTPPPKTNSSEGNLNGNASTTGTDGPSYIEENEQQLRGARLSSLEKGDGSDSQGIGGAGNSTFATTFEQRSPPVNLHSGSGGEDTFDKGEVPLPLRAMQPGAVAVQMSRPAGRSEHQQGNATTSESRLGLIDMDNLYDTQTHQSRNSSTFGMNDVEGAQITENIATNAFLSESSRSLKSHSQQNRTSSDFREEERNHAIYENTLLSGDAARRDSNSGNNQRIPSVGSMPEPMVEGDSTLPDDVEANASCVVYSRRTGRSNQSDHYNNSHEFFPRVLEAELVTSESTGNYDPEVERERVRVQAQQDAEERILASAVKAEAHVVDEDKDKRIARCWKFGIGALVLVVVLIIVVAVVVVTTTSGFKPESNSTCDVSFGPLEGFGAEYRGNTQERLGNFAGSCDVDYEGGFGQWYYLEGQGSRLKASTCESSNNGGNSDTQVLVFAGSCDDLLCIGGSDELCAPHGAVGWMADAGEIYHVLVRGKRKSFDGNFTLMVDSLDTNDNCQSSTEVNSTDVSIFGSTRGHQIDTSILPCEDIGNTASPASWYYLEGDGQVKCTSVKTEIGVSEIEFPVSLSVYAGECNDLKCVDAASRAEMSWIANTGWSYWILVKGENPDKVGDFFLEVKDAPSNSICENAQMLSINNVTSGTTVNACTISDDGCKKNRQRYDQPGVWYGVIGTGNLMVASTCDSVGNTSSTTLVVSHVTVFGTGEGCTKLDCVLYKEEICGPNRKQRATEWFSVEGQLYYVLVQSSSPSEFQITIEDNVPQVPDTCDDAVTIQIGSNSFEFGTTERANATANIPNCSSLSSTSLGVFYKVVGTGKNLTASTCIPGTTFSTSMAIFTGSCDTLSCADNASILTCDGKRSIASWPSENGTDYFIHISGLTPEERGRFALTVDEGILGVTNDFCSTAEPVTIGTSTPGSTTNATLDELHFCEEDQTAPGVWYTLVGDGNSVTASLCNNGTDIDFDTQLRVYSGECTALQCIAFDDDHCNIKSEVTWVAQENVQYFIMVSGYEDHTGNFELSVTINEGS